MLPRLSKAFGFHRFCNREFVLTILAVGSVLPFLYYCAYLHSSNLSIQYYQLFSSANGTSAFESSTNRAARFSTNGTESDGNKNEQATLLFPTTNGKMINDCLEVPAGLVGQLDPLPLRNESHDHSDAAVTDSTTIRIDDLDLDPIGAGGRWSPIKYCRPINHVAIIIPFRDRMEHLAVLLRRLHLILQRQRAEYRIFVPEQAGTDIFNKARLMNLAFVHVRANYPNYTCIIFHDVDMIPENDDNLYKCGDRPRHLSPAVNEMNYTLPYDALIGGVLAVKPEQFVQVNGYSNLYWGWGGEDDDMYYRMEKEQMKVERPSSEVGRYTMIVHKKRPAIPGKVRYKLVWSAKERYKKDGLAQVPLLNYSVLSVDEKPTYTRILFNLGRKG